MRIGIIYLGRRGSGGPISFELARHLTDFAQVFALLSQQAESLPAWQASDLSWFSVPTYSSLPGALWRWLNQAELRCIADQIRQRQPDVLIYPLFYTLNPFLQRHLGDIPSLVAVHDAIPHPGAADRVYHLLENASIRQATRCLVFSQRFAADLPRRGAHPERIDAIPHGELSYYRRMASRPADQETLHGDALLFFGRITAYKGLDVLLHAFRRVAAQRPARLLIAGAGDLRPYQSLIQAAPSVELINRWIAEDEVDGIFRQAKLVVLPYTSASQSGVLAIAASYALPVIASRVGGIPEQIANGVNGLLVDPGSVEQLSAAILRLLDDPPFAARLGAKLADEHQSQRSWSAIAEKVYTACERAIQDHRSQDPAGG
jgi:glycosyltransferase involved in cell wall biosynthesis